jgi:hypothetical protein
MRWTTYFIAACWLAAGSAAPRASEAPAPALSGSDVGSRACLACHSSAAHVLAGPMATRAAERAFAHRAFGPEEGDRFFDQSCAGCHVSACRDCHGDGAHPVGKPADGACLRCHRGYFVGSEYHGRAPREDHQRYQRGPTAGGERFLKMLPDVHHERGMGCADCHVLHGAGGTLTKACRDCHARPSPAVPEHQAAAHLEGMECVACHAAWAPQEYGTFLVRTRTPDQEEAFAPLPSWGPWRKSAYLKRQDAPPLGLNARGMVAPIRPQLVLFATDSRRGWENRLMAAEWKAFTPHTVRRGTVACGGCHDSPRRFLLEADADRLYLLEKDGLKMRSFWSREGQGVVNGSFYPEDRHEWMNRKTPEYVRQHLRQWQNLLDRAAPSSRR